MGNSQSPYSTLILIALMVLAFYLLIIRPNKKRQQAQLATMNSLTPGTRVLMSSGIFGTIVDIGEKQAVLELSPGVHLTVLKQAIARAVKPGDEDGDTDAYDDEDDTDLPTAAVDGSETFDPTNPNTETQGTINQGTHNQNTNSHSVTNHDINNSDISRPSSGTGSGSSSIGFGGEQDSRTGTNTNPTKD